MNDLNVSSKPPGKGFVSFTSYLYMGLGVLFLLNPEGMASGLGYENLNKAAVTDIMATYGGLEIGLGVTLLLFYWNNEIRIGLAVIFLTFIGFAIGRTLGAVRFGGFYGLHCYWLVFELVYLLITNHYMKKYRNVQESMA